MAQYKNVMIYCEITDGNFSTITRELLGCGRKLANDLGEELSAVLIGSNVGHLSKEAIALGADKAYVVDDGLLADYQTDSYLLSMTKVVEHEKPQILILGQTSIGSDLAPRLAFRLNTSVVLDCVELSIDPASNLLLRTKPVYGGKAMALFISESYPQMATIRHRSMKPSERDGTRQGKVITVNAGVDQSLIKAKLLKKVIEEKKGIKLEESELIVSGGRGIGGKEGFIQLEELAKLLKGAVGATRAACDNGWLPTTSQIGLTGKIVAPKLYFAVGLSGSSQHMAGCSGSETIVAINTDSRAHIFKEARFGVVGDWKIVWPVFLSKVKELLER
jgi:electron transfer flavoprotein alpha subunit